MVLKLNTYDSFFTSAPFKFYAVEENGNPDIEEIYYLGEELDLNDPESYDLAIDFLNDCKEYDCEIYDTYKSPILETLLGKSFISNFEKIYDTMNGEIDWIIEVLRITRDGILQSKEGEPIKCCEGCKEAEKKTDPVKPVEPVSKTTTFELARKYIETVMDPVSELPDADYNVILTTLTNYGNWILTQ